MDDADLAGPLVFCFCFATFLLLVCRSDSSITLSWHPPQSGKTQFGYIYGVALLGSASIYTLLNLMSEQGIDAYRVASVLGYCLLPMVGVGALSVVVTLEYVSISQQLTSTDSYKWISGWPMFFIVCSLVHLCCVRDICSSPPDVGSADSRCIPSRFVIRLLRPFQRF